MSVVSTLKTQPPMIADELRRQADQFVELNDLLREIAREKSESDDDSESIPGDYEDYEDYGEHEESFENGNA